MSDKKMLTETTIRRFMKLANVGTLTDNFLREQEEEELGEEEIEEPVEGEAEMPEEEEAPEGEEMDLDMEMGELEDAPAAEADISLSEEEAQLLIDLGQRLSGAVDMDAGEDESDMEDMGDMEDMAELDPEAEEAPEEAPEEEEPVMENRDALVQEVLKRVTKRIISEKLKRRQ